MKKILLLVYLIVLSCFTYATDRDVFSGQSIQAAIDLSGSGDRVLIHAGTYDQGISISGKSGITVTSAGDGTVIVQGTTSTTNVIDIQNSSNIVVSNLTVKNQNKVTWVTGIYVHGTGSGIQILNNIVTDVSYRSGAWSAGDNPGLTNIVGANPLMVAGENTSSALTNIVVSGNQVSYCMTGWNESITIKGNVDGFTVENNTVHHVTNIAIDAYGLGSWPNAAQPRNGLIKGNTVYNAICNYTDNGGIYIDGGKDIVIANNKVYNSVYGYTLGCENQANVAGGTTSGIKLVNNLAYNNAKSGLMIGTSGDDDGSQGDVVNCLVTGNTFLKNATADQWVGELILQNCSGIQLYNNIFFGTYQQMVGEGPGKGSTTSGYNIFYNLAGEPLIGQAINNWATINLATWKGQNGDNSSSNVNPLIVNASATTPDFHLQAGSPGINAGKPDFTPVSGEVDIDGQSRIQNSRVDIGADESGSGGTIAVTGVSVSPTSASLAVSATQQLTATIAPSNATNQTVSWSTSNASVATVNSTGLVTAVAAGSATITATTQDGNFTANSAITVTGGGSLPSPWVSSNIGSTGVAGSATHSSGTFTVAGSGADIWDVADAFRYVYQQVTGDVTVTARVATLGNTDPWAKAGVMIRNTLNSNSEHALTAVSSTSGTAFQRRLTAGGVTTHTGSTGAAPYWVRIQRAGSTFTSFVSANGTSWTTVGSETITMGSAVYVGLAVTSHNNTVTTTATFDNVTVTLGGTAPSAPSGLSATAVSSSQINLSWTDNSSNETGFRIERKIGSGGTYGEITTVGAGVTSYNNTSLSASTNYYFRVRAYNGTGNSAYSNEANATTQSGTVAVTGVSVSPTSASLSVSGTQQLTPTITPANATNQTVSWSTSNTSVATVNTSGLVTALSAGTATITVTTQDGGFTANSSITVTSGGSWTTINSENFESGWGIWVDGGTDALRYTGGSTYAHQGSAALDIQDNTTTSVISTGNLSLASYSQVKVDYWFKAASMEAGEDFWLQISTDGGTNYSTVKSWIAGTDFSNDVFYSQSFTISSVTLTNTTRIRFRCDASDDNDDIYLDEIVISASGSGGGGTTIVIDGSLTEWSSISAIATASSQASTSLKVYNDATYLYFGIEGSGLGPNYQVLLNTDNNTSTGYQHASFTSSGADYYIENGNVAVYAGSGTDWNWTSVGTATASKSGTVCEVRVTKSLLGSLSSPIQVGYADINSSWAVVSKLGFAAYTQQGSRLGSGENSVLDDSELGVKLYPNPASDFLIVELTENVPTYIVIFDLNGKEVFSRYTNQNVEQIALNEIGSKGMFVLSVNQSGKLSQHKILIR